MEIHQWDACFISDAFFDKINDPFLKQNKTGTARPHFLAIKSERPALIWVVPMSSKIEKYQKIVDKRMEKKKPCDSIKIFKIGGIKEAILFQDMFPILPHYISDLYRHDGNVYSVKNPFVKKELDAAAQKMSDLLSRGVRFTPTQPDIPRIKEIMQQEINQMETTNTEEISVIEP